MGLPEQYVPEVEPIAAEEAIVRGPDFRFTVLTSRLLRLEYAPDGRFDDRASQTFWHRDLSVPAFSVTRTDERVTVETEHLRLEYDRTGDGFTADTLSIDLRKFDGAWHYGADDGTLGGAVRTVDEVDGASPLEAGLVSRDGWTVVDDTESLVFSEDEWVQPRDLADGYEDLYFFGYGRDYRAHLADYHAVTGDPPMVPRWALGNWWSRYWDYSQDELRALMTEFRDREIPLSVCMLDMDWHVVENDHHRGWTGWTWDEDSFPDPGAFVDWLHDNDLRTGLNLHPADGVHPHEAQYEGFAEAMGIDPASGDPVEFDAADPAFLEQYFERLIRPKEDEHGVDFWWIDWQQWEESPAMPGLDPLWALNHTHAYDRTRDDRRPFILSRWAGLGSHRYPAGFSGDSYVSWASLQFQPCLTATSANVGYGWWSHDIGGHFGGTGDPREFGELYARWLQFGVFSPVNRIHTSKDRFIDKRPWTFDPTVEDALTDALQLRHALVPYLYAMAWRHHDEGFPVVEPMYYERPDAEPAYHCPQQYRFGTELVVAPHIRPRSGTTNLSRRAVWLPEGDWFDLFTGEHYDGGWHTRYDDLDAIPVYARAGAIVPLGPDGAWTVSDPPDRLRLFAFPGADGSFELYEDDGVSREYRDGAYALTEFSQRWDDHSLEFEIAPTTGDDSHVPATRAYELHVRGVVRPDDVQVDGAAVVTGTRYDDETATLVVELEGVPADEFTWVTVTTTDRALVDRGRDVVDDVDRLLRSFDLSTMAKREIAERIEADPTDRSWIDEVAVSLDPPQVRALVETLSDVGFTYVREADGDQIVLWNETDDDRFRYRFSAREPVYEPVESDWHGESGPIPGFATVDLDQHDDHEWEFTASYGDTTVATYRDGTTGDEA